MRGDLPYWKFMGAQKELRSKIKKLSGCCSADEFVSEVTSLPDRLMCYDLSYDEEQEFKEIIKNTFTCEPWNFIGEKLSPEYLWLHDLHPKLKSTIINKQSQKLKAS